MSIHLCAEQWGPRVGRVVREEVAFELDLVLGEA